MRTINVTLFDGSSYSVSVLLVNGDTNTKLRKSNNSGKGYLTAGLSLAPANESQVINVCSSASKGCAAGCLFKAGYGAMSNVIKGRVAKTVAYAHNRHEFMDMLILNIKKFVKKAKKENKTLAIRLNVLSDIMWEKVSPELFTMFPDIQFYDYTKHYLRMMRYCAGSLPSNYHLTFSRSEVNSTNCESIAKMGGNVAVVFANKIPTTYMGLNVVSGDETDLRFVDDKNVIVGLKAKGPARKDKTGFVV